MSQLDLLVPSPVSPRRLRRRISRRAPSAAPLPMPREPAAFVATMLAEYRKALRCEARARCYAKKLTMSLEERAAHRDAMDEALRRMGAVQLQLTKALSGHVQNV